MSKTLMMMALVAAMALAGSAAAGGRGQVSADDAAQFKVGVATYNDVVAKLGRPSSTTAMSDGTRIVVYVGMKTHVKAASFIPVVGLFAGGATSDASVSSFTFGPDGLLQRSSATDSNIDCSSSIVSMGCQSAAAPPPPAAPPTTPASAAPPAPPPPATAPQ